MLWISLILFAFVLLLIRDSKVKKVNQFFNIDWFGSWQDVCREFWGQAGGGREKCRGTRLCDDRRGEVQLLIHGEERFGERQGTTRRKLKRSRSRWLR